MDAVNEDRIIKGSKCEQYPQGLHPVQNVLDKEAEMNKILKLTPTPGSWMERARDLFVFQMFTGLSFADAQAPPEGLPSTG